MKFWAAKVSVVLVAAVAAGAAGVPASASVPVGVSARGWSVTPSPNPVIPAGQLFWVSCPAANSCLAVGTYTKASGAEVVLAERWNGSTWRIQPAPSPPGAAWSNLFGVSCVSPSACEAVGTTASRSGAQTALAERWNGSSWQIQHAPSPAGGGQLNGVSCTSPSACTAVGGTPPGTPRKALNGVACTSATACTAVGNQTLARTLAERWNGNTWSVQATPNPAGAQNITLGSVACPARTVCTAFGLNHIGSSPLTLAERWSGGRWRLQPTPGLVANDSGLQGVACPTVSACFAVAAYTNNGSILTLAEQWNRTGASTQAAAGRLVAPGALPAACLRARMPGSLPISGRITAMAGSRFWAGSFPNWADAPTPASHSYERGKA